MVSERLVQRHGVTVVDTELPGLVYFQGPASPTNLPPVPPMTVCVLRPPLMTHPRLCFPTL